MYTSHAPRGNVCSPNLANDSPPDPPPRLTFADLTRLEPGLADLAEHIRRYTLSLRRKRILCGNGVWYGYGRYPAGFKLRMSALVGWGRRGSHPDPAVEQLLRTPHAYSVAYGHLYALVPNCRRCACL